MKEFSPTKAYGRQAAIFAALAFPVYFVMIGVTLRHLELHSGLLPLDLRPGGFSMTDVVALFEALGAEGRSYYLTRQLPLDLFYPFLLAMTLASLFKWFRSRGVNGYLMSIGFWLTFAIAAADYAENFGIATMLLTWAQLEPSLVAATSIAAIAKASVTTITLCLLMIAFASWLYLRIRRRATA